MIAPAVAVLMPTYGHAFFIRRALDSLFAQTFAHWELVIVDDGSPDDTAAAVATYLADPRARYRRLERNRGLGAALNVALDIARAPLVAYLPSDDVYYAAHLATLVAALDGDEGAVLVYSGARHHYNRSAPGLVEGYPPAACAGRASPRGRALDAARGAGHGRPRTHVLGAAAALRPVRGHGAGVVRVGRPPRPAPQGHPRTARRPQPLSRATTSPARYASTRRSVTASTSPRTTGRSTSAPPRRRPAMG